MNRTQLAHVLRAASQIVEDAQILVIGSQAILGSHRDDELPEDATLSVEADIAFWHDPDGRKADEVEGSIGEESQFHQTHGYYGSGVVVATAVLPFGWEERVVPFDDHGQGSAVCVEKHDLVVSKLVAGREKDYSFARALITEELVDPSVLLERAGMLPRPEAVRKRVRDSIRRYCT